MFHPTRVLGVALGAAALLSFTSITAPAQASVKSFYKGKTMTLFSGYSPGSTYSVYARTMSRHLRRLIPGNPRIINKSMTGGGGIRLGNFLYNVAKKDGSVIAAIGRDLSTEPLLFGAKSKAKFDPREFTWLGSLNSEVSISAAWHTSGVKTLTDAQNKTLIVASNSPTAQSTVYPSLMNAFVGTKFKTVCCYSGGNLMNFAMERGEVQGRASWSWSSVKRSAHHWYKSKKIYIISQQGFAKHPDLPHIPLITDLAKSKEDKQAMRLLFYGLAVGRPYVSTPGLPKDRAKALRSAFKAVLTDAKFLAEAKKRRLEINQPKDGATIDKMLAEIYQTPRNVVARAASASRSTRVVKRKANYRTVKATIAKVGKKGRSIIFKEKGSQVRAFLHRRASKITIAGKKAKGKKLKAGLSCAITYEGNNTLAKAVACK
jgi:tripartite-type tricarboxylate transporter receptor subunit TctC